MTYLVIANGKIVYVADDMATAEGYCENHKGDFDTMKIAEVILTYKRKVSYDKVLGDGGKLEKDS